MKIYGLETAQNNRSMPHIIQTGLKGTWFYKFLDLPYNKEKMFS